ncbi:hypothetical protein CS8_016040 [Cupriavidus sp. 8B]
MKPTPDLLSVALKIFTGIDTRPKLREREAMERAAIAITVVGGSTPIKLRSYPQEWRRCGFLLGIGKHFPERHVQGSTLVRV